MQDIKITKTTNPRQKPADEGNLAFGRQFTDHMLLMNYTKGRGWHDARIEPYHNIELDPATTSLHYGQLIFEGLKAYKTATGEVVMFRPDENMKRLCVSGERLCIPPVDVDSTVEAIAKLVEMEADWIPTAAGTSLYIRPFILSTDAFLGVAPSDTYLFMTILCPVGPYYKGGLAPVSIYVENDYVRAVRGGTGHTKSAGNYAASLRAQVEAEKQGYAQVLWLDGVHHKYVEEVGSMNVFFVLDGEVVTPALTGSLLPGITRMSVIRILQEWGIPVSERQISIDEIADAHKAGKLSEAFGTGTAAVISPIGELKHGDTVMKLSGGETGEISRRLYSEITGIQKGEIPDRFGWLYKVK